MSIIFEASFPNGARQDFTDVTEAAKAVEAHGRGALTKFLTRENLPGLLPKLVYNSLAHWGYGPHPQGGGRWLRYEIHAGTGHWAEDPREAHA